MKELEIGMVIWLRKFPYEDKMKSGKRRPCLVLEINTSKVTLAEITSFRDLRPFYIRFYPYDKKRIDELWYGDVIIEEWESVKGLSEPSAIRTNTIIQIHTSDLTDNIITYGGLVSKETMKEVYRYLNAIESMYFEIPYFFTRWCVRYQPKYRNYLNIDSMCKTIEDLHEEVELNSLDVSIIILKMCLELGYECALATFKWNKAGFSKYHTYCIWKERSKYTCKAFESKREYISVHCMYDGHALSNIDVKAKTLRAALANASYKYCNNTELGYKRDEVARYVIKDKELLERICEMSEYLPQQELVYRMLGHVVPIDNYFNI